MKSITWIDAFILGMIHLNKSPLCWLLLLIDEMLLFSPALMMQSKYLWKWSSPAFSYLFRIINLPILNPCVHVYSVCRLFAIPLSPDHSTCSDSQNSSLSILITQRLRDFLSQWASCPHNENLHNAQSESTFDHPDQRLKHVANQSQDHGHSNFEPLHSNGTRTHTHTICSHAHSVLRLNHAVFPKLIGLYGFHEMQIQPVSRPAPSDPFMFFL